MKVNVLGKFATILLVIGMVSCDEELTEFNINSELQEDIDVEIPTASEPIEYSTILEITQDSDISENLDKIKEFNVEKVTLHIEDYDGPDDATLDGEVTVSSGQFSFTTTIDNINLKVFSENKTLTVSLGEEELDKLGAILLESNQLNVEFSGSASDAPANFKLVLTAKTKAQVDAV